MERDQVVRKHDCPGVLDGRRIREQTAVLDALEQKPSAAIGIGRGDVADDVLGAETLEAATMAGVKGRDGDGIDRQTALEKIVKATGLVGQ